MAPRPSTRLIRACPCERYLKESVVVAEELVPVVVLKETSSLTFSRPWRWRREAAPALESLTLKLTRVARATVRVLEVTPLPRRARRPAAGA